MNVTSLEEARMTSRYTVSRARDKGCNHIMTINVSLKGKVDTQSQMEVMSPANMKLQDTWAGRVIKPLLPGAWTKIRRTGAESRNAFQNPPAGSKIVYTLTFRSWRFVGILSRISVEIWDTSEPSWSYARQIFRLSHLSWRTQWHRGSSQTLIATISRQLQLGWNDLRQTHSLKNNTLQSESRWRSGTIRDNQVLSIRPRSDQQWSSELQCLGSVTSRIVPETTPIDKELDVLGKARVDTASRIDSRHLWIKKICSRMQQWSHLTMNGQVLEPWRMRFKSKKRQPWRNQLDGSFDNDPNGQRSPYRERHGSRNCSDRGNRNYS